MVEELRKSRFDHPRKSLGLYLNFAFTIRSQRIWSRFFERTDAGDWNRARECSKRGIVGLNGYPEAV